MCCQPLMLAARCDSDTDLNEKFYLYRRSVQEAYPAWVVVACEHNSARFLKAMVQVEPDFVWYKDMAYGEYTVLHCACKLGRLAIVKALVDHDPELCSMRDDGVRSPLHVVATEGNIDLLRILIQACPLSLNWVTGHGETALHLLEKNGHDAAFEFLMRGLTKDEQRMLLSIKDDDGNTVLHSATSMKLISTLSLLLGCSSSSPVVAEMVNFKNKNGFTALDIHYRNISRRDDKIISELLHGAGAKERKALSHSQALLLQPSSNSQRMIVTNLSLTKMSVFVTMLILFAGGSFTTLASYGTIFPHDQPAGPPLHAHGNIALEVGFRDIIVAPNLIPDGFFFIAINMLTFTVSIVTLMVTVWRMEKKWVFSFKAVVVFLMSTTFICFALMVKRFVPKIDVCTSGSRCISSFVAILVLDLAILLLFCMVGVLLLSWGLPYSPEDDSNNATFVSKIRKLLNSQIE